TVQAEPVLKQLQLRADLDRLHFFGSERDRLDVVERPRVDAAALVAGGVRGVDHRAIVQVVAQRRADVDAIVLEDTDGSVQRGDQAVRRIARCARRPDAGLYRAEVRIPARVAV